ncbi:trace amine-associated receptor 13c-like [Hoplias malabaricus]|uniref:trace amine-associated receptor 13c-like n=1 Tax=Hoplias malabaricus TaxID=27720 RepID=UPI0034629CCD
MDDIVYENITVQYCFPENNASCRKEVRTGPAYIFLFIVLSCISVCTVFLNLLVIISISHFKQLHTPTNLIILSLAVADLIVGLIVMPGNIMQLIDSCWYLGKLMCLFFPLISSLSVFASVFSMVLIAVDRYIAVCDPFLYPSRVTVCKMSICIILGWSFLARRQAKAVRSVCNSVSKEQEAKVPGSSETKAAKKLSLVIFVYLLCWIPFYLTSFSVETFNTSSIVWTFFGWLLFFNSSINPIIYAIFYQWFRVSVKLIMTCRIYDPSSSRFNLFHDGV